MRLHVLAMAATTVLGLTVAPSVARADVVDAAFVTVVSVRHSPTGPVVDSGAAQLWRADDADIHLSGSVDDAVTVTVADGGDAPAAELSFAAPRGESLVTGSYEGAQRVANRTAGHAGVHYDDDEVCTGETGRFTVLDIRRT